MKVLISEVPKAPVATVQVWYKVGSRNEVMGRAGLSHMLEHMMFKGTAKYPKGAFSRLIRKSGGMDNAFTSQDFTAYFENLAADRVELALEMEADRMQGLILDLEELKTEREVVKEERRLRTEDDPQGALVEALFAQAYMSHPYHWPVIGWFGDLDAMTLDDLQRHYDTYYSPNNATLVIVGDVNADGLISTIRQLFEPIPRGPEPKPVATMEGDQKGERRFYLKRDAQVPFVMMGYRVPNYTSEDSYALDVLESILSRGKSSRLYQSLVYEQSVSLAVGAEYGLMQTDPGLFYFYALVRPGVGVETVEEALQKEIKRIQTDPPTEQELQRAKNQVEAARVFEQDSNFRHAMLLGQAEAVGAGWRKVEQFLERIRAVTPKDVQRVAVQYLTDDARTVGTLIPVPPKQPEMTSTSGPQGKP
ncbi:putative Zn-dependent peptidase, M16 family [Nitrospira sp. KM1]|nr:putative Zn-dependent peptidase, M16 family [Nitrospira sp. KM1]